MSGSANLRSTDAIEAVRAAMAAFASQADEGLVEVSGEMRRMLDWVEHDRPAFWKKQVRLAYDGVGQAKAELHRCLMFPVGVNDRPSCAEQRAALKKAQAHLAYCEAKQAKLKEWVHEIRHELHDYHGRTACLREVIDSDSRQAITYLNNLLLKIEEYTSLNSPTRFADSSSGGSAAASASDSGTESEAGAVASDEDNPDEDNPEETSP